MNIVEIPLNSQYTDFGSNRIEYQMNSDGASEGMEGMHNTLYWRDEFNSIVQSTG